MKMDATTIAEVDLEAIRIDGGTQARHGELDLATVQDYYKAYLAEPAGSPMMPPVDVFFDGTDYWLADGFHRRHAAEQAGLTKMDCVIHKGTNRDAILFAVGANRTHGLKRTNLDKRKAIGILLADKEWSQQSDRWLAETAGVSNRFVGELRAELCTVHSSDGPQKRKGKDGKVRMVKPKTAACKTKVPKSAPPPNDDEEWSEWSFPPGSFEHWDRNVKRIINEPVESQARVVAYLLEQVYFAMVWQRDNAWADIEKCDHRLGQAIRFALSITELLEHKCPELVEENRRWLHEGRAEREKWKAKRAMQQEVAGDT